jgi:hypothetical protein
VQQSENQNLRPKKGTCMAPQWIRRNKQTLTQRPHMEDTNLDVESWTTSDVSNWLDQIGFPQYKETFAQNCIDGSSLLLLDRDYLKDMKVLAGTSRCATLFVEGLTPNPF